MGSGQQRKPKLAAVIEDTERSPSSCILLMKGGSV